VQKYQKTSDEVGNTKSKVILDEFRKSSMYAKLTGANEKSAERQANMKEIYNPDLNKPKKVEGKTTYLARSKTEDALLKSISQQARGISLIF
jgi:hypothetical protein